MDFNRVNFVSLKNTKIYAILAFPFKSKSFAIAILLFFSFVPSCHFFCKDYRKILNEPLMISYQESVLPRSYSFLEHTKKFFRKDCYLSCYS